jgi:hypothetical protein
MALKGNVWATNNAAGTPVRHLPQAGLGPTSCWRTKDPQSVVAFPEVAFVDDTPPIREKSCSRELRLHSRIAPDSGEIPQPHLIDTAIGGEAKVDLMSMRKLDSVHI